MIEISIIGYGYWGPKLLRNFQNHNGFDVKLVVDVNPEIGDQFYESSITFTTDINQVLSNPEIKAVAISTPISTHFELAKVCLEAGKHVLIEKPATTSLKELKILRRLAEENDLSIIVDHTFLYTGAIQKTKEAIQNNELGELRYFDGTRINLGLIQLDTNVLWDLASHDLSILFHLIDKKPLSVQAIGISHLPNAVENISYLTLKFEHNLIAHFHCSWSAPVKTRKLLIGGSKKMLVYDDIEPTNKIKIYDSGHDINAGKNNHQFQTDYRVGDIFIPKIQLSEALFVMVEDFHQSITKGTTPISNIDISEKVIQVLELAELSLKNNGEIQYL